MIPALDIFVLYPDGAASWLDAAHDIVGAKTRMKARGSGRYMVFNPQTGTKLFFDVNESGELSDGDNAGGFAC